MHEHLKRKFTRLGATALSILLVLCSSYTLADPVWVPLETTASDIATINSLMTPLAPLVGKSSNHTLLSQSGTSNFATSSIVGSGNLSLVGQQGNGNRSVQAIEGNSSAALLVQAGSDNAVLQVSRGDNNFQLVAVSGHGNDVAYIQVGDDLAGALDVRGSVNSSVLTLQTPGSGNYLMPKGLTGLQNQLVIVVPGRMYVINKNAL